MKKIALLIAIIQIAAMLMVTPSCSKKESAPTNDTISIIPNRFKQYSGQMFASSSSAGSIYADSAWVIVTTDSIKADSIQVTFDNVIYSGSQTITFYHYSSNQDSDVYYLWWPPGGGTLVKYNDPEKIKLYVLEFIGVSTADDWSFTGNRQ